jgi:endonuclease YncB( thermonuclease family)
VLLAIGCLLAAVAVVIFLSYEHFGDKRPVSTATVVTGLPRTIDGDTLRIGNSNIRLHGIDAPELSQSCRRNGVNWACGRQAHEALRGFLGNSVAHCEIVDFDHFRRPIGRCSVGGLDVQEWMVAEGWAVAYRKYSEDYVAAEAQAQNARKGVWSGQFELPWKWRQRRRRE